MTTNDRRRRIIERIGEDERLRGSLEDDAASALLRWAGDRAGVAAGDASQSDEQVEATAQAVRQAAAAAAATGESDPRRLIARAEAELQTSQAAPAAPDIAKHSAATGVPLPEDAAVGPPAASAQQPRRRAPSRRTSKTRRLARYLKQKQAGRR
jgi:hypothetical protein